MANIWLYALGTERFEGHDERVPGEWVRRAMQELQTAFQDTGQVSEWIPFRSEYEHRDQESYVVLLVPPSDYFGVRDYFIAANALALEETGRLRVLPVMLDMRTDPRLGIAAAAGESAHEHRNRRVRDSLMRLAVCSSDPKQGSALCGELVGRLKADMTEWPKRKPSRRQRTVSLFFSYSHLDAMYRDELARHLELLGRTGLFETWYDKQILPGDEWASEIDTHLCTSDVVLLLLSADFFTSQYCNEVEVPFARERHIAKSARVIPVLLRPVAWGGSWLYNLQALPVGALPVSAWPSMDPALVSVCEGILGAALAFRADAAQHERKTTRASSTRKREVDTAMPHEVQIDRSAMLIVLIRKTSSEGLRGLLAEDASYGVEPEDVHSRTAAVQFPYKGPNELRGVELAALVRSPDFDPPEQQRRIQLAPDGDSQPVIFMLAAKRPGWLRAMVEIYHGERLLVSCPMSTLAVAGEVSGTATAMGSAAIAVEETAPPEAGGRHISFEPEEVLSFPGFPERTSPQAVREFLLRQQLAIDEKRMRPGDFSLAQSISKVGDFLQEAGRLQEAEALYRRALASQEERADHYTIGIFLDQLAGLLRVTNQLDEAELLTRRSIAAEEKRWGPEAWGVGLAMHKLAGLLLEMRKEAEAEVALRRTIAIIAKGSTPESHDYLERVVREFAKLLAAHGMSDQEMLATLRETLPQLDEFFGSSIALFASESLRKSVQTEPVRISAKGTKKGLSIWAWLIPLLILLALLAYLYFLAQN